MYADAYDYESNIRLENFIATASSINQLHLYINHVCDN